MFIPIHTGSKIAKFALCSGHSRWLWTIIQFIHVYPSMHKWFGSFSDWNGDFSSPCFPELRAQKKTIFGRFYSQWSGSDPWKIHSRVKYQRIEFQVVLDDFLICSIEMVMLWWCLPCDIRPKAIEGIDPSPPMWKAPVLVSEHPWLLPLCPNIVLQRSTCRRKPGRLRWWPRDKMKIYGGYDMI